MKITYYFDASIALKESSLYPQDIYFYDGVSLTESPKNCINVPIDNFSNYFLTSHYPYPTQISFDGLTLSTEVQNQILTSISNTINDIQQTRLKLIEELLEVEINNESATVLLENLCQYILSHQLLQYNIPTSIVQKMMHLSLFIQNEHIMLHQNLKNIYLEINDVLHSQEEQMLFIHLQFAISLIESRDLEKTKEEYIYKLALYDNIVDYVEYFKLVQVVFPKKEGNNFAFALASILLGDTFWQNSSSLQKQSIFKLYNVTHKLYAQYFDNRAIFTFLYSIFEQALEREDEEILFFLHTPLQFSWNRESQTQKEMLEFHTKVEKVLENFISEKLIPKYQLQPVIKQPYPKEKKTLAIVYDRLITGHSVTEVLYTFLKTLSSKEECPYDIIVYNLDFMELGGGDSKAEERLQELNITYINLHKEIVAQKSYDYDIVQKVLQTRQHLIDDKVDILIGFNTRIEFNFLFTTRTAPQQVYWTHGNLVYQLKEIDSYISHFIVENEYKQFKAFTLPVDMQKYNPVVDSELIKKTREQYLQESFILGSIGRLIKLDDEEYIQTIASIMKTNPQTIYLACGAGNKQNIEKLLKKYDIEKRVYFTGKIDPHLYGHIIDLWLTPFKFGGGEALQEYIYKGKPFVLKSDIYETLLRIHDENNKDLVTKIQQKSPHCLWENYTQENIENLKQCDYLYPCNKDFTTYFYIPIVKTKQQFIDVANFLINNPQVGIKIGKEHLIYAKNTRQQFCKSFIDAIESKG